WQNPHAAAPPARQRHEAAAGGAAAISYGVGDEHPDMGDRQAGPPVPPNSNRATMTVHALRSRSQGICLMLAVLLLAATAPLAAQSPDALHARVDSIFAEYNRTDSPGCALGVYRDGSLAYARGFGMANLEL